jgi:lysylphosphatidylglycerol synthetase-like protein (DUF2156 family)
MDVRDATSRQRLALVGIVIAIAGAIWGVIEVTGSSHGFDGISIEEKLFLTMIAAAIFAFVIGSGARLVERQEMLKPIGYLTILLALVAFEEAARRSFRYDLEGAHRVDEVLWIAAIAAGQVSLLLSWPEYDDRGPAMATAGLASLAVIALGVAYAVEISKSGPNVSATLLGVLIVLYLLGLVLVPLVSLATRSD